MSHSIPHVSLSKRQYFIGLIFFVIVFGVALIGIAMRLVNENLLRSKTNSDNIPKVQTITPKQGSAVKSVVLPGNIKPFNEALIYARVNGYLQNWFVDIGTKVKAGQLLAQIETPELDQQILRAEAEVATAQANYELSEVTNNRWQDLLNTDSVTRQEADEKMGDSKAKKSIFISAQANLKGLRTQQAFNKIVAPFDGQVTERKVDIGMLVSAGGNNGQSLFKIADYHKLRCYVDVPQNLTGLIKPGLTATVSFPEKPGKAFSAALVGTSGGVNEKTRTLTVEFLIENASYELIPGTYAEVRLELENEKKTLSLPTSSLLFRKDGMEVAVLDAQNHITLKPIIISEDLGGSVEISSGVDVNDRIIDSPSDSVESGDLVRVINPKENGGN